jgi:S-adenosylmethionine:tRNA ribosyltransferase-isomerase
MAEILEAAGKVPLPPYIVREANDKDKLRYQTVYAQYDGSVAAPTAGLHFTDTVIKKLEQKHISHANVTLHVGAGTFKPISEENVAHHIMHHEQIHLKRVDLECLINAGERVIAVGTTSLRSLESFYWQGVKVHCGVKITLPFILDQWEPYDGSLPQDLPASAAWKALLGLMDQLGIDEIRGETRLFIVPGYRIRTTQILITNFHQPRSTLLLLVASFAGATWRKAYAYALNNNFRFLSYGDACLFYLCNT